MSEMSLGDTSTVSNHDSSAPHTRILSFAAAPPPPASHNPHGHAHLNLSRQYTAGSGRTSTGAARGSTSTAPAASKRRIPSIPDRVLDAPGFKDDYYLNLISWSSSNKVAIGLSELAYVWNADTGDVTSMGTEG